MNHPRFCAVAISTTAGTASTDPAVITARGPRRSSHRPTAIPASADTSCAPDSAAITAGAGHPVSRLMSGASTGNA